MIPVGESREIRIGIGATRLKLWVTEGQIGYLRWSRGWTGGRICRKTDIRDREIILPTHAILGFWVEGDIIPRTQGFVSVGSRRYKEWQTLAYEATTDCVNKSPEEKIGKFEDLPEYVIPKRIIKRPSDSPKDICQAFSMVTRQAENEKFHRTDAAVTGEGRKDQRS